MVTETLKTGIFIAIDISKESNFYDDFKYVIIIYDLITDYIKIEKNQFLFYFSFSQNR
jgi:hypothetical protein